MSPEPQMSRSWKSLDEIEHTRYAAESSDRAISPSGATREPRERKRRMRDTIDIAGLLGFTASGVLFVISALRTGDTVALAGSVVWIVSCLGWITALYLSRQSARGPAQLSPRRWSQRASPRLHEARPPKAQSVGEVAPRE